MDNRNKYCTIEQAIPTIRDLQQAGKKVVFTNGCFDILHSGHVQYLEEARSCGDFLIVGINSDSSVKRLKGANRPINNEEERALILSGLEAVNMVILFQEDTPYELIKAVQPDILVKGGDWSVEQIVGADIVLSRKGIVKSLSFKKGNSTTSTIERIIVSYQEGTHG